MAQRASNLKIGQTFEDVIVDDLRRSQIVQYAGASGDYNPLHTDHIFAVEVGGYLRGTFSHGMLTMAMTARLLTDVFGATRLRRYGGRFVALVWPGDTLTAFAKIQEIREKDGEHLVELAVSTKNQNEEEVFAGNAVVNVDP